MSPVVSIIIVNYHAAALIRECLKSLAAAQLALPYEVIVVDNSNERKLQTMLAERFPDVVYLPMPRNMGLAVGNNTGARLARGEYLLVLNPDITVKPGAVEQLIARLQDEPAIGLVAPQLLDPDGTVQQSYFRFYSPFTILCRRTFIGKTKWGVAHLAHKLMRDIVSHEARDVDWLLAACFAVKRSVWEEVGGMDERFFVYFEDVDLARRLWLRGYRAHYLPTAQMIHLYGHSSGGQVGIRTLLNPLTRIHIQSGIRYFSKHGWRQAQKSLISA